MRQPEQRKGPRENTWGPFVFLRQMPWVRSLGRERLCASAIKSAAHVEPEHRAQRG